MVDHTNGEEPIPWDDVVSRPTLYFSSKALPPKFLFRRVSDYNVVEASALYLYLYDTQEGNIPDGIRFSWIPMSLVKGKDKGKSKQTIEKVSRPKPIPKGTF